MVNLEQKEATLQLDRSLEDGVQVSASKKPLHFYVELAKRFLQEHGEVQLSAIGLAIPMMVNLAEILKGNRWAVETRIRTGLDVVEGTGMEGQNAWPKAKMEVVLQRSPQFDELMAGGAAAAGGPSSLRQGQPRERRSEQQRQPQPQQQQQQQQHTAQAGSSGSGAPEGSRGAAAAGVLPGGSGGAQQPGSRAALEGGGAGAAAGGVTGPSALLIPKAAPGRPDAGASSGGTLT